ncbi:metabotropic glutamate receptor 3-like [Dendronephthya gigantea]|uniref:metabotropic glutamate receptor 3-like n=1 Tax=Dendronephthya gigantea TaxID=151771 RepID=UPI001069B2C5|nr:metabotropic glutamate receptor 3-like [Dendronephthya gigantea]
MFRLCLITLIVECCIFTQVAIVCNARNHATCDPPKRIRNNFTADVIIGGLIPVHAGGELKLNEPGVMWVEAMMFAIDEINKNASLLPGITLGFDIRDSCNKGDLALGAALDFMLTPSNPGSYARKFDNKNKSSCFCNTNASGNSTPPVIAVVGGASSRISTTVSPVFSTDNIPQISYSSTSPTLSDKGTYRTFFRTIPSDLYQAQAIADILEHFNWTYVSIVVSDDEYGRNGLIALGKILKEKKFCIAEAASFSTNSNEEMTKDAEHIIRRLQEDDRQRVVVLWCERPAAIGFLRAATGKLSNITWIGTESWGDNAQVKNEVNFELIRGMLGVVPYLGRHAKFDEYLKTLTPKSKQTNPWLGEYWSKKCATPNCMDKVLPNALSLPPNKYANVMDAVYSIAYGLQGLKNSRPDLDITALDKQMLQELLKHIRQVNFHALSAKGSFVFTKSGDPVFGAYLIKNLQGDGRNKEFVPVAQWNGETSELEFEENVGIQWNQGGASVPLSRCSEICQPGFGFVRSSRECCWTCPKCQFGYIKSTVGNEACFPCPDGYMSTSDRKKCVKVEEDILEWNSPLSIVVIASSFLGLILVVFIIAIFRKYSATAVVKASNREVSLVHLTCHALVFLLPLLYIGRPRAATCIARLNFFPVLFTFITAIMFLKTDRIVRIFNSKSRLTKRSRLLSNKVQFVLTIILTLIPVIGTGIWLALRPLTVKVEPVEPKYLVYCENEEACQIVQLAYILLLALLCTYEAFHARKLPESFNEAKFICFSMFAFVLMWVGYIPVCIDITGSTKQFMTCLFIILINFLTVMPIYMPKLNIILIHPEHNRHESFRKATMNTCLKEARRLSAVGSPNATPDPQRSSVVNQQNIANDDEDTSPETDKKIRSISTLTDVSFGSNEQLVARHLGLPEAKRMSSLMPELDNGMLEKSITSM